MIRGIDHIVIAVRDLAAAAEDYRTLGFTVTPGGEHTGGATRNTLISFADGSYFELLAFAEPDREQEHRWWATLSRGEGTVDFALLAGDLGAEAERLRQAGVAVDGPRDGGRLRPDGQRIAWRSIMLDGGETPLPFVIEDVTARDLRVPPGAATEHPLGISGVAGLVILAPDLERAAPLYEALLGAPGDAADPALDDVHRRQRFPLGGQWIELAEPDASATVLHQHIRDRGAAPYEIVLAGAGGTAAALPADKAHGANIRVEGR